MDKAYIQWNMPNWITITLMAFIGFSVFALGKRVAKNFGGEAESE